MGHVVSADSLKADREKVQAIADMPMPTSKAVLQCALGVINYLSRFIPDMSVIRTHTSGFAQERFTLAMAARAGSGIQ